MTLNIIRQEGVGKFINASASLRKDIVSDFIYLMEQTISFGNTDKEIEMYKSALEDIKRLNYIRDNLDFYTECFCKKIEDSSLLNDFIYEDDKINIMIRTIDDLEIGLYDINNNLMSVIHLNKDWLSEMYLNNELKYEISLFKFDYEKDNYSLCIYNNKIKNNKGLQNLDVVFRKLGNFEKYFNIICECSFYMSLLQKDTKFKNDETPAILYSDKKESLTLKECEDLMFLDVIFNYYNWTGVFGIKSNEELRLFLKRVSKVKKYFHKQPIVKKMILEFNLSGFFDMSYIFVRFTDDPDIKDEIVIKIRKDFSIGNLLKYPIITNLEKEPIFTYSDYLFNKKEVVNYINLIDY